MAKLKVIAISDGKEEWLQLFSEKYVKKISAFCTFDLIKIKPYREARENLNKKNKKEGELVAKAINDRSFVVICDEGGQSLDSMKFSKKISNLIEQLGSRDLVFIIGGAYGLSDELKERADLEISLSFLVFNHHIALAVLLEQIYRSFTIMKKIPYHNI